MWKPTNVTNLWMHGGNLHQSRHCSLYLTLQLQGAVEGWTPRSIASQEVHHTS